MFSNSLHCSSSFKHKHKLVQDSLVLQYSPHLPCSNKGKWDRNKHWLCNNSSNSNKWLYKLKRINNSSPSMPSSSNSSTHKINNCFRCNKDNKGNSSNKLNSIYTNNRN